MTWVFTPHQTWRVSLERVGVVLREELRFDVLWVEFDAVSDVAHPTHQLLVELTLEDGVEDVRVGVRSGAQRDYQRDELA